MTTRNELAAACGVALLSALLALSPAGAVPAPPPANAATAPPTADWTLSDPAAAGGTFEHAPAGSDRARRSRSPPSWASVTFDDQHSDGRTVTVASVTVPAGGFVTLWNSSADLVGVSRYVERGTAHNVTVALDAPLAGDVTLVAVPYPDPDDDRTFDPWVVPYVHNGSVVSDSAAVSVARPATATDGPVFETGLPLSLSAPPAETASATPASRATPTPTGTVDVPTPSATATTAAGPGFGAFVALAALGAFVALAAAGSLAPRRER